MKDQTSSNNCVSPMEGMIDSVEVISSTKNEKLFKHTVIVPADNRFDHPSTFHVISHRQISQPGNEVSIFVKMRGFISNYKKKYDDGESKTFQNPIVALREVILPS